MVFQANGQTRADSGPCHLTTGQELRRNNEKIPEPDQINYDRDMNPKYMLFNPNYDVFEKI
jgi:hypothetical protein